MKLHGLFTRGLFTALLVLLSCGVRAAREEAIAEPASTGETKRMTKSGDDQVGATAASAPAAGSTAAVEKAGGASSVGRLGGGALGDLATPRAGKMVQYSSAAPDGGNADFRRVEPGQTFTLMDHRGAGIVRRWWLTTNPINNRDIGRQLIIRCYWDGETNPSVEVPLSDFFGMGFGEWRDYISLPLSMTSGGYNCYWPMPFSRSARITVENRSQVPVIGLYYNIALETHRQLPSEQFYFHAQFRRRKPAVPGQPITILQTTGRGHYVGTLLSMQLLRGRNLVFLEGDERIFVDGERTPSLIGTGTEDYFAGGHYFLTGTYAAPYHGATLKDTERSRINAYRWHIEDAIPFQKSLRFDIEHGGANDMPLVDYTSVAFWYQTHPHPEFPPLPADLMPSEPMPIPKIAGIIEGESLAPAARATEGAIEVQNLGQSPGDWSDLAHLWWRPARPGARLTLTLNAPETRPYELIGYFTRARDYGDFHLSVNGQTVGPIVRGYSAELQPSGPISFGRVAMRQGANEITLEITGKDARSSAYLAGVDGFVLKP